jgi:methionine salvage enolase-phosphatase E1
LKKLEEVTELQEIHKKEELLQQLRSEQRMKDGSETPNKEEQSKVFEEGYNNYIEKDLSDYELEIKDERA